MIMLFHLVNMNPHFHEIIFLQFQEDLPISHILPLLEPYTVANGGPLTVKVMLTLLDIDSNS